VDQHARSPCDNAACATLRPNGCRKRISPHNLSFENRPPFRTDPRWVYAPSMDRLGCSFDGRLGAAPCSTRLPAVSTSRIPHRAPLDILDQPAQTSEDVRERTTPGNHLKKPILSPRAVFRRSRSSMSHIYVINRSGTKVTIRCWNLPRFEWYVS